MQELLLAVARGLVEDKDAVKVTVDEICPRFNSARSPCSVGSLSTTAALISQHLRTIFTRTG